MLKSILNSYFFNVIYNYEIQYVNLFVKFYEKNVVFFVIELVVINFKIKKSIQQNVNNQYNKIVTQTIK